MAFTIPDQDTSQAQSYPGLARVYQTDVDILMAAQLGSNVVQGGAVTASGVGSVAVASGIVNAAGVLVTLAASATLAMAAAHASLPRIDLVYSTAGGVATWATGTAGSDPTDGSAPGIKPPALPAGGIALAYAYVPAASTTVSTAQLVDKRVVEVEFTWSQATIPAAFGTTAAETSSGNTFSFPANSLFVGQVIQLKARGVFTTAATPGTDIIRIKFGATVLALTATYTNVASMTNVAWEIDAEIVVTAIGASGTVECAGEVTLTSLATNLASVVLPLRPATPTAGVTVDTTASQALTISVQPSVATQSWTTRQMIVRSQQ